ncbi:FlaR protein (FlaR) [Alteromonas infernus]
MDANSEIGTGHVMRCLTLAKGIQNMLDASDILHSITFVNSQESTLLQERYGPCNLNHEVVKQIDSNVEHVDADLWIVDHYQLDETFEQKLSLTGAKVMVIDDLANRPHYCDLLLDVNFSDRVNRYETLVPPKCKMLLGPEYALLRQEFYEQPTVDFIKRDPVRVLVCFGGSDPANMTSLTLDSIASIKDVQLQVDIVIGSGHQTKRVVIEKVNQITQITEHNIRLHIDSDQIAKLMQKASLMVGAGGSMHWERCISMLPALVVCVAENQVETTRCLSKENVCRYLGFWDQVSVTDLARALVFLLQSPSTLQAMSECAGSIVPRHCGTPCVTKHVLSLLKPLPLQQA